MYKHSFSITIIVYSVMIIIYVYDRLAMRSFLST